LGYSSSSSSLSLSFYVCSQIPTPPQKNFVSVLSLFPLKQKFLRPSLKRKLDFFPSLALPLEKKVNLVYLKRYRLLWRDPPHVHPDKLYFFIEEEVLSYGT
jgi:hypothetical protein